jgi:hypothetical protein
MGTTMVFKPAAVQKKALRALRFALMDAPRYAIFSGVRQGHQPDDKGNKGGTFSPSPSTDEEKFDIVLLNPRSGDSYLYHAWVHSVVTILIRTIARADFVTKKEGYDNGEILNGLTNNTQLIRFRDRNLWNKESNPWGDAWYRPKNMAATTGTGDCPS